MLSVIGPEHGAASEAECGAGKVANGGRERIIECEGLWICEIMGWCCG